MMTNSAKSTGTSLKQLAHAADYAEKHAQECARELIAFNAGTPLSASSRVRKLAKLCSWAPRRYGLDLAESLVVNAALKIVAGQTGHEDIKLNGATRTSGAKLKTVGTSNKAKRRTGQEASDHPNLQREELHQV
jgi:hypothetical protein